MIACAALSRQALRKLKRFGLALTRMEPFMSSPSSISAILERFESAWQGGERPSIEDHLPADPALRAAVLPELALVDLERRLKAGEKVHVEDYLRRFPELEQNAERVLTLCAVEFRWRGGSDDARIDLAHRFPRLRETLLARLSTAFGLGPSPAKEPPPSLPERFGRYRVARHIKSGGMGSVYLAFDTHLHRP